jgi:hypothetical protein
MDIGWAVEQLRQGIRVRRSGWDGVGSWLVMAKPAKARGYETTEFVMLKTHDGKITSWTCSQSDLLAHDWESVSLIV